MKYANYNTTIEKGLMRRYLENPDILDRIKLSKRQLEVFNEVCNIGDGVSSRQISDRIGVVVQSASNTLNILWMKGYLERRSSIDPTGGVIYLYRQRIKTP